MQNGQTENTRNTAEMLNNAQRKAILKFNLLGLVNNTCEGGIARIRFFYFMFARGYAAHSSREGATCDGKDYIKQPRLKGFRLESAIVLFEQMTKVEG